MKRLILIACLFANTAVAETLTTNVDRESLGANQTLNLEVELEGGRTGNTPDFSPLNQDFQIVGQGQSSMTKVINGHISSSQIWNLALRPKHEGRIEIPALSVDSVTSQPVAIEVGRAQASRPVAGISFVARPSRAQVYKGERFRVDYSLRTRRDLQNMQVPELSIANAIVERNGEPHQRQNGVDFSFYVTPMKDGALTILPLMLQGQVTAPAEQSEDPFAQMEDDFGGGFPSMRQMMKHFANFPGFGEAKAIRLASNRITMNVLPPVAGVVPWLPTSNLTLSETLSDESGKVGEPIDMNVVERAANVSSAQLPSLEDQIVSNSSFKVYPGQVSDQKSGDTVTRTQKFTLIPQRQGALTLPAAHVAYFDPRTASRKVAELPTRTLQVAPGVLPVETAAAPTQIPPPAAKPEVKDYTPYYAAGLGALALLVMGLAFLSFKKDKAIPIATAAAPKRRRLSELDHAASIAEVLHFCEAYAQENYALNFVKLARMNPELLNCKKIIEADLFAGKRANLETLRLMVKEALRAPITQVEVTRPGLPELNPL